MPELYLRQKPEVKNIGKLIGRIKLAAALTDFTHLVRFIKETEEGPLFQQLFSERIIRYQRFRNSSLSSSFEQIQEFNLADNHPFDDQSFLEGREKVIEKIKALGKEEFEKYLYGQYKDGQYKDDEIDKEIREFIDDFSIASQFSSIPKSHNIHYSRIARIEKANQEFHISYFSWHQGRGRYSIDYEKLKEIEGKMEKKEKKGLNRLIKNLRIINNQKLLLHSILESIVKYQKPYLESGNYENLNALTQKRLAEDLGVNPSSISRSIRYKSVETSDREIPLKRFFVKENEIRKRLLKQIIAKEEKRCSDRELKEKFSLPFSRRTIAHYRKLLNLK